MSADVPSYQHGKPYKMDNVAIPKSLGVRQRAAFNTSRDTRCTNMTMVKDPQTIPQLLQNIKVSLNGAW